MQEQAMVFPYFATRLVLYFSQHSYFCSDLPSYFLITLFGLS